MASTEPQPKLPPLLFPPVDYYLQRIAGSEVDYHRRYDKRLKDTHRYHIVDTRGRLSLTVPVAHPQRVGEECCKPLTWADIPLSRHNSWWDKHRVALESAYGRTPYFEFYIDRLLPLMSVDTPDRFPSVSSLAEAANAIVEPILMLDHFCGMAVTAPVAPAPYPQIRADRLGFIPGLSVLDLIFNQGPESPLYLQSWLGICRH